MTTQPGPTQVAASTSGPNPPEARLPGGTEPGVTIAEAPAGPNNPANEAIAGDPAPSDRDHLATPDTPERTPTDPGRTAPPSGTASVLGFEASETLPRVLRMVGAVVAPTTFLTALLFYYGLLYAIGYFGYFGVNVTVLNIPNWNYLVLSADGAIIPLVLLAGVALVLLSIYQLPLDKLAGRHRRLARWILVPAVAVLGVALVVLAGLDTVGNDAILPGVIPAMLTRFPEARGLSLAGGVTLVVYSARLHRAFAARHADSTRRPIDGLRIARWASISMLIGVGLFWAVGSYAAETGFGKAVSQAADLACEPEVVLYTEKSLNVQAPGVVETPAGRADAAYGFRYSGLRLLPQAGDQYLFLPADWAPGRTAAILVPRHSALRMEFIVADPRRRCPG